MVTTKRLLATMLVMACCGPALSDEAKPLKRLKTPLPSLIKGQGKKKIHEVIGWVSDIVVSTTSQSFECAVTYEVNRTGTTRLGKGKPLVGTVSFKSGSFRFGEEIGTGKRRVVGSYLPAPTSDIEPEELEKRTRVVDAIEENGMTNYIVGTAAAWSAKIGEGETGAVPDLFQYCGAFHPTRAAVTPLGQIRNGRSIDAVIAEIKADKIVGVSTVSDLTYVLLDHGAGQTLITFQNKCPVQMEMWLPRMGVGKDRQMINVTRSRWSEVKKGVFLPTHIEAMTNTPHGSGNMSADVTWRLGKDVDPLFFNYETMTQLLPTFSKD